MSSPTKKEKPALASVGLMSAMGFGVVLVCPAFGVAAPLLVKGVVCFGCAWSANETLKKFTGRIPKRLEVKTPPVVKGWSVFVGRTTGGKAIYHNLNKIPHSKVAGVTGAGKSVMLSYLTAALCMNKKPSELEVWVIDLKDGATFAHFAHFPHVRVIDNIKTACEVLEMAVGEVHKRNKAIAQARFNFNKPPYFKRMLIVIDEGGEMAPKFAPEDEEKELRDKCMSYLSSIVRLGREPRVNVLYGTQRPSNETLPTFIRGMMDATFCFRVENELDSEIALRHKGAELLQLIPGRYIYKNPDIECEVQAPFINDETLEKWIRSGGKSDFFDIPYGVMGEADDEQSETGKDKAEREPRKAIKKADRQSGLTSGLSSSDFTDQWNYE